MATPAEPSNTVKNFDYVSGRISTRAVPFVASVAVEMGSVVYPDPGNPGYYTKADDTAGDNFGIIQQTIATTDSDYASTKNVTVEFPSFQNTVYRATRGSGTLTSADIGKYCDLYDEKSLAVDTSSKKVFLITGVIDADHCTGVFAGNVGAGLALPATT
jgi:hypothetical protein